VGRNGQAAQGPGGPEPIRCHLCSGRWLDFQCRCLALHGQAERAVAARREAGLQFSHDDERALAEGFVLLLAHFFEGAHAEAFGTWAVAEVYPYSKNLPARIVGRLKASGALEEVPPAEAAPATAPGGVPRRAAFRISTAGQAQLVSFFGLLSRLDVDPKVVLNSRHLSGLRVPKPPAAADRALERASGLRAS
jgi:hypothetical protein